FIFSTARDLEAQVREGKFREDLLHRLRVLSIQVPPLRERPEDLPGLVQAFFAETGGPAPVVGRRALERLRRHPWPGNVRQLWNLLSGLRVQHPREIGAEAIDRALADSKTERLFPRNLFGLETLP